MTDEEMEIPEQSGDKDEDAAMEAANSEHTTSDESDGEGESGDEQDYSDEEGNVEAGEEQEEGPARVYLPGEAEDAEKSGDLVCDMAAYSMYHTCGTLLPCLSFDVIPDNLGENRATFPATCYCVAGSQADRANKNSLLVMKMTNLTATKPDKGSDEESEEDESDDEDLPELECAQIRHIGSVNRLKFCRVGEIPLAATFSETAAVHLWNLSSALNAVDDSRVMSTFQQNSPKYAPVYTFSGHKTEGYALAWSRAAAGCLASGDADGRIFVWKPSQGGQWHIDARPYTSHSSSVEDIQWSPHEPNVFASCSSDKSIKIWDVREKPSAACKLTATEAHSQDVNVIHWNPTDPFLVSGSDAGDIKIWDLRRFTKMLLWLFSGIIAVPYAALNGTQLIQQFLPQPVKIIS
ncbi:glutamate-rich WD repeat-containing protein 1-like isoform X3 [Paramacrobiotus metropolitanus]|uniref:glutamate-rich WD repeat-containing protein 1-like isoform X3 n=1 Tax=Paramacrobiotus metropolitanus TaxID=2943436 RepID=UPI0024459A88|nr:glutamate-rich WD repeat-containing protein 1-like isoform X3 [Paramacrobiotus metropolitanus]